MTEKDLQLIDYADNKVSRWEYWQIDDLIPQADTEEAREKLWNIRWSLKQLRDESL